MFTSRRILIAASALMLVGLARDAGAAAEPPRISKPRPAPPNLPPNVPLSRRQ